MHLSKVTHTCSFYKALSNTAPKSEEVHACASSSLNIQGTFTHTDQVCNWPWRL